MTLIPFAGHDPDEAPLHSTTGRHGRQSNHCKKGHPFSAANTQWVMVRKWKCRRCRQCLASQNRLRYEINPEFREAKKAAGRRYWHRKRKHDLKARETQ